MNDFFIRSRSGPNNIFVLTIISVICCCLPLFFNAHVFAGDLTRYKKMVRDEAIYPRDCRYLLPAAVHRDSATPTDRVHLQIATELEKMGILKLAVHGSMIRITAADNTSDIVQQNFNMSYELQSLNLVLGAWDVEITSAKESASRTILSGSKVIKKTTRLYVPVLGLLPLEEKKKYSTMPAKWELSRKGGSVSITEVSIE